MQTRMVDVFDTLGAQKIKFYADSGKSHRESGKLCVRLGYGLFYQRYLHATGLKSEILKGTDVLVERQNNGELQWGINPKNVVESDMHWLEFVAAWIRLQPYAPR